MTSRTSPSSRTSSTSSATSSAPHRIDKRPARFRAPSNFYKESTELSPGFGIFYLQRLSVLGLSGAKVGKSEHEIPLNWEITP